MTRTPKRGMLAALAIIVGWPAAGAAQQRPVPSTVFHGCYVPLTGTVYRIKEIDTRQTCGSPSHVEFSWTDGAQAVRDGDAAGGDLAGTYPRPVVTGLLNRPLANVAPQPGQVLAWDGSANQWKPASAPAPALPTAYGDVAGTYPALDVVGLLGTKLAVVAPQDRQVLTYDAALAQWRPLPPAAGLTVHGQLGGLGIDDHKQYLPVNPLTRTLVADLNAADFRIRRLRPAAGNGEAVVFEQVVKTGDVAGGDLGGQYPNPQVTALQGNRVSGTTPVQGDALVWAGGQWEGGRYQFPFFTNSAKVTVKAVTSNSLTVDCPSGSRLLSGGVATSSGDLKVRESFGTATSWTATTRNDHAFDSGEMRVYAICLPLP